MPFHPEERLGFVRNASIEMSTIVNGLPEEEADELHMRFAFTLEREGMAHGSVEEREFADGMAKGYLVAVQAAVDKIRKRVKAVFGLGGVEPFGGPFKG